MKDLFFELLQVSLGRRKFLSRIPTTEEWSALFEVSESQAISGIILNGLVNLPDNQRPPKMVLLQWLGVCQMVRSRNSEMDTAVVKLCKKLDGICTNYIIVKGQTLNAIYPLTNLRQSGDIDFLVYPGDWHKVFSVFSNDLGEEVIETHSEKHVEWEKDGVTYEMHRWLNDFASKKHQRYWDDVVMQEVWHHPYYVEINGYNVPTLSFVYNVLYVFVHLFYHLINEGVGLRQFLDWYYLLLDNCFTYKDKMTLKKHLRGIGLYSAFVGCGAVLTDYLGLDEKEFPFEICEKYHLESSKLIDNIYVKGNFGHNTDYKQPHGIIHGLQQFWQVLKQCFVFGKYAPGESWGYLLVKVRWWRKKLIKTVPSY